MESGQTTFVCWTNLVQTTFYLGENDNENENKDVQDQGE